MTRDEEDTPRRRNGKRLKWVRVVAVVVAAVRCGKWADGPRAAKQAASDDKKLRSGANCEEKENR